MPVRGHLGSVYTGMVTPRGAVLGTGKREES